jgi:hypothetical protein
VVKSYGAAGWFLPYDPAAQAIASAATILKRVIPILLAKKDIIHAEN